MMVVAQLSNGEWWRGVPALARRVVKLRALLIRAGIDYTLQTDERMMELIEAEDRSKVAGGPGIEDAIRLMELWEPRGLLRRKMSPTAMRAAKTLAAESRKKWGVKKLTQIMERLSRAVTGHKKGLDVSTRFKVLLASWLMPDQAGAMSMRPIVYCSNCHSRKRSHQSKRRGKHRLRCQGCKKTVFAINRRGQTGNLKLKDAVVVPRSIRPVFE